MSKPTPKPTPKEPSPEFFRGPHLFPKPTFTRVPGGWIGEQDKSFFAFDLNSVMIGEYHSAREAQWAIDHEPRRKRR